jgi:CheY-like chemotaxis protein
MGQGNILVVDDDESVRRLLMEYLRERSHGNVDGARDGVDALHQVAIKHYAVVVLDVIMPYMSGVDFLSSLDALLSDPSVKSLDDPPAVFVITSAPPEDVRADELQHRFPQFVHGVMRKPLDIAALGSRVAALVDH